MAAGPAISDLFSSFGLTARTKLLILGTTGNLPEVLLNRTRSLNLEHVSPAEVLRLEISRRTSLGVAAERRLQNGQTVPDEILVALMRRWFWMRKPDAGFALAGFPATLLQAKIFDEWLDARNESLDSVMIAGSDFDADVALHYRTLGLLTQEPTATAA